MHQKKINKRRKGFGRTIGIALSFTLTVCLVVGASVSFATAGASDGSVFGLQQQVSAAEIVPSVVGEASSDTVVEETALTETTSRDISQGIDALVAAEEEARRAARQQAAEANVQEAATHTDPAAEQSSQSADGWMTGIASAYNIASSSVQTASGATLTEDSVTVAVPASQGHLLGRLVEIKWRGMTVIATVTDTGGFASYGRALDLAPGVCKAFGVDTSGSADNCNRWGVQTVQYRFI